MGKEKKQIRGQRHAPLAKVLLKEQSDEGRLKQRVRTGKLAEKEQDATEEEYISHKLSKKILGKAREQAEEEKGVPDEVGLDDEADELFITKAGGGLRLSSAFDVDDGSSMSETFSETESQYNQDHMTVASEDERALSMFMNPDAPKKRLLSDIIMEKIRQHEEEMKKQAARKEREKEFGVPEKPSEPTLQQEVVEVYRKIGHIMANFSSGKLPKAFRILPILRNWEQLLYLTRPDGWSAVATRMATMLFSRNMSEKLVQRFYSVILVSKIREDILTHHKLNFHLYLALKKSLYRPAAFFRGVLLPLCEAGDCTLREAVIIGSILKKVSIPALHASVAIYKLAQMPYYGSTQHFLLVLLNKKHSLPYQVIDAVATSFEKFLKDDRKLPVLWHQTLLVFVQRYKGDLTIAQKEMLRKVMAKHSHYLITPEIRRELFNSKTRGTAPASALVANTEAGNATTSSNAGSVAEMEM